MHNHSRQNSSQQPEDQRRMTLNDALLQSTGIPALSEKQQQPMTYSMNASLPMNCTPSSSAANGINPWMNMNTANFLAAYTPLNYWGLMSAAGGCPSQGLSPSPTLYSPNALTPSGFNETSDENSVVELAKRTIVLCCKSSNPMCSKEQQSGKLFLNWVTKTFNLPINAIQEVSNELEIPSHSLHDPTEKTSWKMGFVVLHSSKTHDNIISMFEANIHQMQQCYIVKAVDVLLEGSKSLLSTSNTEDLSCSIPNLSISNLVDCFRVLSKSTRSTSSSRSTPSSATTSCSAFQSLFPYGVPGTSSNGMNPAVQNLLDAYSTQYSTVNSTMDQPTISTTSSIAAENMIAPPNDFDLSDGNSSTTAALYKHIQKVTENSFWD